MPAAIETKDLTRVYHGSRKRPSVRAVVGVGLEVEQGEVVALLGPNGAGKTTMVRMLACLLRPTTGEAWVGGHDVRTEANAVRALCGVSMEAPGLYDRLTAEQYLTFFARMYGVSSAEIAPRVEQQLGAAGLWERRDERLGTYSKGMRQKINIARALLHRPRVVFLDEPTSGLDVEAARTVRDHIQEVSQDEATTFLICTHNLPEAERLCHRIVVMNDGQVVAVGAPEELKRRLFGARAFRVELRRALPTHQEVAASAPGVAAVDVEGDALVVHLNGEEEAVNPEVVRRLVQSGAEIISYAPVGRTLEDVYLRLVHQEQLS